MYVCVCVCLRDIYVCTRVDTSNIWINGRVIGEVGEGRGSERGRDLVEYMYICYSFSCVGFQFRLLSCFMLFYGMAYCCVLDIAHHLRHLPNPTPSPTNHVSNNYI